MFKLFLDFIKKDKNWLILMAFIVFFVLGLTIYVQNKIIDNVRNNLDSEVKLKNALLDTVHFYVNKESEWTAEKLSIQESLKSLKDINNQLTDSQKELINRIKEAEKNNTVIAGALIQINLRLDGLTSSETIIKDSSIVFKDSTKDIKYDIVAKYCKRLNNNKIPELVFEFFELPNKQFVEFHWKDNKKDGYPISFSVSNSNKYFKTVNIDSYVIPELQKIEVKPNGWQKFDKWALKNGKIIIAVGSATSVFFLYTMLTK